MRHLIFAVSLAIVCTVIWLITSATAKADEPRWGTIVYDGNRVQYTLPKCKQSRIKDLSIKKKDGTYVIKLECEPVPGEVTVPNPDFK